MLEGHFFIWAFFFKYEKNVEQSRIMLLKPSPVALQSQRPESLYLQFNPTASCTAGICHTSNKTQPHAFQMRSRGTFSSQWHSHIQTGSFAGEIADGLWLGHNAAELIRHTATGVYRVTHQYRIRVHMFLLSMFLLEQPQDCNQSWGDDREQEDLGGLDGRKGGGFSAGKRRISALIYKILPTRANAAKPCAYRELDTCEWSHWTQLSSVI